MRCFGAKICNACARSILVGKIVDKITIKPAKAVSAAEAQDPNFPMKSRCNVQRTPVVSKAGAINGLSSIFFRATPVISKSNKYKAEAKR